MAPPGMTWQFWINSDFNTGGFYSDQLVWESPNSYIGIDTGMRVFAQNGKVILLNGKAVRTSSEIEQNGEYVSNTGSNYNESLYTN